MRKAVSRASEPGVKGDADAWIMGVAVGVAVAGAGAVVRGCRHHNGGGTARRSARFQGQWGSDQKHCGTDDDSRLTIGAGQIRFYESGGSIKAVVMQGQSDLAVIIALSGEGETWLDYRHFRLSADGKTLTDVTVEPELVRHRCPKGT